MDVLVLVFDDSVFSFFFYCSGDHRDRHVLTHSFPTRRSSDLLRNAAGRAKVRADRCSVDRQRDIVETADADHRVNLDIRSEEHTSELQSLMRISYAVFCLKKKTS